MGRGNASDAWVAQATWEEFGAEVRICVDPDEPASHVVILRPTARCGDGNVGSEGSQRARRIPQSGR